MPAGDKRYNTKAWRNTRLLVLDRDGWLCQVRGQGCSTGATAVDHIITPSDGGEFYALANLRAACKHCNSVRGARYKAARGYKTTEAKVMTRW